MEDLLRKTGYTDKAIQYYIHKVNVGKIEEPSVSNTYTGPCGDTLKIYLVINDGIISDARFEAIGCAGAFAATSALMNMIKGKSIEEAEKIQEEDIVRHLGGMPGNKRDCISLAVITLEKTINLYKKNSKQ